MTFDMRHLTTEQIVAGIDLGQARQVFAETWCTAPSNSNKPWQGVIPALGTWRLDSMLGELSILVEIPLDEVEPVEQDWEYIKRHWTYQNYLAWAKEGRQYPPVDVIRNIREDKLLSLNRRRVLVQKEIGSATLLCWFSETGPTGLPLWKIQ
jgi:hypothetical protein